MTADALSLVDRLLAERACERLIIDFVRRLDLGDPGSVAELFTPDGGHGRRRHVRLLPGEQLLRVTGRQPPRRRGDNVVA